MTQKEVAEILGIAEATLFRWLNETQIQSRAMDNLLRVFFAFPQVRAALHPSGFADLTHALNELKEAAQASPDLSEEQKAELVCDIMSIQAQLNKSVPNKAVVSSLWSSLEQQATAAGLTDKLGAVSGYLSATLVDR